MMRVWPSVTCLPPGLYQTPGILHRVTERYSCCDGHWRCYCINCLGCGKPGVVNAIRPTDSPLCATCIGWRKDSIG
jgi:hypothetical protein